MYTKYLGKQEAGKELLLYDGVGNDALAPLKKQYINLAMQPSTQWYSTSVRRRQSRWPPSRSLSTRLRDIGSSKIQQQASRPILAALTSFEPPLLTAALQQASRKWQWRQVQECGRARCSPRTKWLHGRTNHGAANLAESPGLLHGKMACAKILLASHCKTFMVQGCSPCSPRASSSRGRRRDHCKDVCPPPRAA